MPYLIDGNNLLFALDEVGLALGREGLCKLLAHFVEDGERTRVVFDGPPPPEGMARQIEQTGVEVSYSGGRSADDLIVEHIAADSAPRLLNVVSTDHRIRRAARKRRCGSVSSQDFARKLVRADETIRYSRPTTPTEPDEKRQGLSEEQTRQWMREFGLDE